VTTLASGKPLAEAIHADVRKRVAELSGGPPCLCVVLVGEDPASQAYVRGKDKAARACGIDSRQIRLPATTTEAELLALVDQLNRDPGVHGLLVQLPLPDAIDPARIALAIDPAKDVDGLHPLNAGRWSRTSPRRCRARRWAASTCSTTTGSRSRARTRS
jgi:methylenetetrahydrofolate dehydrogenase (NADP+)/methenyltetrahydrofolate cyclohydrolase